MKITDHLLSGNNVTNMESPNRGGPFAEGALDTIIIHYTAGSSAEGAISTLMNPANKMSAHVVVAKDGLITQLVPFNIIAWHAGNSSYQGRHGFNKYSIGIEIDNAGKLVKTGDKYIAWFGKEYNEDEVIQATHRNQSQPEYWARYSEMQLTAVMNLCQLLIAQYPIRFVLGHEEIAPARKEDPGPAFPLDKFRSRLLTHDRAEEGASESSVTADENMSALHSFGLVTAQKLNIREQPFNNAALVTDPLAKGTVVKVNGRRGQWYHVDVNHTGWVSAQYVKI